MDILFFKYIEILLTLMFSYPIYPYRVALLIFIHSSEPNSTDFIKPSAKHTIVSFGLVYSPNQLL